MSVKIAVLVSGGGTNMQVVIDQIKEGNINGKVEIVISSNDTAFALERAAQHGIEGIYIGKKNYPDGGERTKEILRVLQEKEIGLIVLAGYMSILDEELVNAYKGKIINIHPSLIPSFCGKGYYGERVHQAVLDYGVKISGATVHFVDEEADTGPVILQKAVEVKDDDTVKILASRVLEAEHQLLPQAVKLFCEGRLQIEGRKVQIKELRFKI